MNNRSRRPNRLKDYDYSQTGYYLVTICTRDRVNYFGEIEKGRMQLSDIGQIVTDCWRAIPEHFHNTALDEFVVMPNHVHEIVHHLKILTVQKCICQKSFMDLSHRSPE